MAEEDFDLASELETLSIITVPKAEVMGGPDSVNHTLQASVASPLYADVIFKVTNELGEEERIPAHKCILAARSIIFKSMLFPPFPDAQKPNTNDDGLTEITITDTAAEIFRYLLEAAYTDWAVVTPKRIIDTLAAADKYCLPTLRLACRRALFGALNLDTAFAIWPYAPPEATGKIRKFIESNFYLCSRHAAFYELTKPQLIGIVSSNSLGGEEFEIFDAVLRWGKHQCEQQGLDPTPKNVREALDEVIDHIRFPTMEAEALALKVAPTDILSRRELISLFSYKASDEKDDRFLTKFSAQSRTGGGNLNLKKWILDPEKSNGIDIRSDGWTIEPTVKSCGQYKYIMTNLYLRKNVSFYYEVLMGHTNGCYDSIGFHNGDYISNIRNGGDEKGWALRVYGNHSSAEHAGAVHQRVKVVDQFHNQWAAGDRIGCYYDHRAKAIAYFRNDQYLGTPFTGVTGDQLYPCIEICHHGNMKIELFGKLTKEAKKSYPSR